MSNIGSSSSPPNYFIYESAENRLWSGEKSFVDKNVSLPLNSFMTSLSSLLSPKLDSRSWMSKRMTITCFNRPNMSCLKRLVIKAAICWQRAFPLKSSSKMNWSQTGRNSLLLTLQEAQGVVQVEERCGLHQEVRRTSLGINEVTDFLREAKAKDLSVLNFPNEFLVSKILTQLHESSNGVL